MNPKQSAKKIAWKAISLVEKADPWSICILINAIRVKVTDSKSHASLEWKMFKYKIYQHILKVFIASNIKTFFSYLISTAVNKFNWLCLLDNLYLKLKRLIISKFKAKVKNSFDFYHFFQSCIFFFDYNKSLTREISVHFQKNTRHMKNCTELFTG